MSIPLLCALIALIGYLFGSIPSGFLVGKARGIDIRQHGSGNIGATNVSRTLGKKWGVLVFALDVIKGFLAIRVALLLAVSGPGFYEELGLLAGFTCFLGHCFPVWLGFKGGKGIAVGMGILLGLAPWVALIGITLWGIVYKLSRYVSLASVVAASSLPIIDWGLRRQFSPLFWFIVVIALIAVWRHRSNIHRLLNGTENRF